MTPNQFRNLHKILFDAQQHVQGIWLKDEESISAAAKDCALNELVSAMLIIRTELDMTPPPPPSERSGDGKGERE